MVAEISWIQPRVFAIPQMSYRLTNPVPVSRRTSVLGPKRRVQKPLLQPDLWRRWWRSPVITGTIQRHRVTERWCQLIWRDKSCKSPTHRRPLDASQVSRIVYRPVIIRRRVTIYNYFIIPRSTASGTVCQASVTLYCGRRRRRSKLTLYILRLPQLILLARGITVQRRVYCFYSHQI